MVIQRTPEKRQNRVQFPACPPTQQPCRCGEVRSHTPRKVESSVEF